DSLVEQLLSAFEQQRSELAQLSFPHDPYRIRRSCTTRQRGAQSEESVKIVHLDAFSGVSGDMTVGALLDLGLPLARVRETIAALGLDGVEVDAERVVRNGIGATKFHVRVHGEHPDQPRHYSHYRDHVHRPYRDI